MKILKEKTVTKKLKEDYASRIAELYDTDPEGNEDVIAGYMARIGKLEQWQSPEYSEMDVNLAINELLTKEQKIELIGELGGGNRTPMPSDVVGDIINALSKDGRFSEIVTFEEAGLMTHNKGFVVRVGNKQYQFSLLGSDKW